MTDKQIIIDGVDVSRCESFCNGRCCKAGFVDDASCKFFSDCNYKQFKRLEQAYQDQLCHDVEQRTKEIEEQPDRQKEENKQLKQTISEIKEIAENTCQYNENCDGYCCSTCKYICEPLAIQRILNKISEVEQ